MLRSVRRRRAPRHALLAVTVLATLAAAPGAPPAPAPPGGAAGPAVQPPPRPAGIGDPLFPHLGNPGYDVRAYDIALTYRGRNDVPLSARTEITARVTARLPRLNLDFTHGTVRDVTVNGRPAAHARAGEDLVVTPARTLYPGDTLRVAVRHTSDPRGGGGGWIRTGDGLAMANQADAAHRVFPGNDHPADKARFTFRVTAPGDLTVVANGLGLDRERAGARTTWTYRTAHPMATELAQVSIGRSAVLRGTGPHGLPLRHVVPERDRRAARPVVDRTSAQIAWMERQVGRYPLESYGVLSVDAPLNFALETQTLSVFGRDFLRSAAGHPERAERVFVHELAHQWFGNSVTPRRWSDLWLNEGHATWYEALFTDERHDRGSLVHRMRAAYELSDAWRREGGPPAAPRPPAGGGRLELFRPVVYDGGALVLYALRREIGTRAFGELERAWVTRHRDGTAGTADFVALASEVAGRDLEGFLHAWLYDERTPPMPGHPGWRTAEPAQTAKTAKRAKTAETAETAETAKTAPTAR
ncbi:M1 family metallopeptidase [Streptomyces sp. WMMC500]|uniref:M1 family metallopeptidase n=1 Tax=Streptomyces sp. WMMC500 TaxID=3015154 RepID=UPI00248CE791|nr:M1 family metallopeptidase [Streptomyces sp. WMMC500]WBB62661.1 M1 family metallopeptidase [Streptomyces sp. WMMC500]